MLTSTSYIERHNLVTCISLWRFARLTNAFSKRIDRYCGTLTLGFVDYNLYRYHASPGTAPQWRRRWLAASMTSTGRWVFQRLDDPYRDLEELIDDRTDDGRI